MLKHLFVALVFVTSAFFTKAVSAEQSTAYISDELYIFMHSGAGKNYRILGSINAGTEITLVTGTETNGFYEIVDDKERQGWVEAQYINQDQSLRIKFEQLGEELANTQQTLRDAQSQIPELQNLNSSLQDQNQQLQEQLATAISERDAIQNKQQSLRSKRSVNY
ncbi:TIGR04211 family SH3 domain-containing protein [Pseudoalteromonas sp. GB56]